MVQPDLQTVRLSNGKDITGNAFFSLSILVCRSIDIKYMTRNDSGKYGKIHKLND